MNFCMCYLCMYVCKLFMQVCILCIMYIMYVYILCMCVCMYIMYVCMYDILYVYTCSLLSSFLRCNLIEIITENNIYLFRRKR